MRRRTHGVMHSEWDDGRKVICSEAILADSYIRAWDKVGSLVRGHFHHIDIRIDGAWL